MRINTGMLDRRVTLFAPVLVRNPTNGETVTEWQERGRRYAAVLRVVPTDTASEEQLIAKAVAKLLMKFDSLTRTILPTWRVSYDGQSYDVVGTEPTPRDSSQILHLVGLQL
jgi:head-tail adaptor